jgi:hypothetical protein
MNLDEAGRLQKAWKTKHGDKPCHHTRVIDSLIAQDGKSTEKVVSCPHFLATWHVRFSE